MYYFRKVRHVRASSPPRASFVCHGLHAATPLESRRQGAGRFVLDLLRKSNSVSSRLERVHQLLPWRNADER